MAADDGAERSHEATPRRREQALQDGRILSSKDLAVFVATASGAAAVVALGSLGPMAIDLLAFTLREAGAGRDEGAMTAALGRAAIAVVVAAGAVGLPVALAAVLLQAATGGLHWNGASAWFRGDRINPLAGLGRMFSLTALVELAKALAKVVLLGAVTLWFLSGTLPCIATLDAIHPEDAGSVLSDLWTGLFGALVGVLAVIGAADLVWQARVLNKSLRMTLDEVRREHREDNGAPELKARLRRMQSETSRRGARERAALADVPRATSVITNPQHFAVALYYQPGETPAPVILARGTDRMAARIVASARKAGVPVLPMPPLARALYYSGDIGAAIDDRLYGAVAAVLAHVWRLDRGHRPALPDVDLPPELRLDAWGRRDG